MCQFGIVIFDVCGHSAGSETACKEPGSSFCGIQKTFSVTSVSRRVSISCPGCLQKFNAAASADAIPESADVQVGELKKAPKPSAFVLPTTNTSFTFTAPPFSPSQTTRTQKDVEEKWKTLEDTIRWDDLLTTDEKLGQSEYKVAVSPTRFRFKLS